MPSKDAEPAAAEPVKEQTIMIGNGGDIIIHSPFYRSSAYKKDGDYDFTPCFSNIKDVYGEGDFSVIDIETCLPGKDVGRLSHVQIARLAGGFSCCQRH